MKEEKEMWTIVDGIDFVRTLFSMAKECGYHVGLIGSVLRDGKSNNDLDIVFLPYENDPNIKVNWRILEQKLKDDYSAERARDMSLPGDQEYEQSPNREVWKAQVDGKEIDFFVYY